MQNEINRISKNLFSHYFVNINKVYLKKFNHGKPVSRFIYAGVVFQI